MLWKNAAGELFADSEAVGKSAYAVPGATLEHMGFGEFYLVTPAGRVDFDRMRGSRGLPMEGVSGRSHLVYGDAPAVAALVAALTVKEAA